AGVGVGVGVGCSLSPDEEWQPPATQAAKIAIAFGTEFTHAPYADRFSSCCPSQLPKYKCFCVANQRHALRRQPLPARLARRARACALPRRRATPPRPRRPTTARA